MINRTIADIETAGMLMSAALAHLSASDETNGLFEATDVLLDTLVEQLHALDSEAAQRVTLQQRSIYACLIAQAN